MLFWCWQTSGPTSGSACVFLFKWKGVSYSEYLTGSWLPYSSYGNYYRTYSGKSAHTQNVQGLMSTQTLVHSNSNRRQWWTMELVIHLLALFNVFEYEALVEKYCLWPISDTFHLWDICSHQSGDISIDIEINCIDIKIDIVGQYQTLGSLRFRSFFL